MPPLRHPLAWIDDELATLDRRQLLRQIPQPLSRQGPIVAVGGKELVNFASNDYLALASDQRLARAAQAACREHGVGRGASPLICGRAPIHEQLERRLAEFEGVEAALLFPSGFAANAGVIPALADQGDVIFSDAKNHASIVDGCRLARAEVQVYPHCDAGALEEMLRRDRDRGDRRRLIVTDTLFSMDGDLAPLPRLADLARRYHAMLMVDEAHATGVFGRRGRGVVEFLDETESTSLHNSVHVRVGTLSKALGAAGGFVCGSGALIQWLANRARSYVFSTAQPAASAAAALVALEIVQRTPQLRTALAETSRQLRDRLRDAGWDIGPCQSQIIPLLVGSPERALELAERLRGAGFWAPAIRPPSVPAGESLLRITLTAGHAPDIVARFLEELGNSH